jgi:hypothetical protein
MKRMLLIRLNSYFCLFDSLRMDVKRTEKRLYSSLEKEEEEEKTTTMKEERIKNSWVFSIDSDHKVWMLAGKKRV